ncbi:DUF3027 domain-containing protein [Gordonia desulfuricans]|uniref:DUF3027 domain-containing protein n=1 Tax=Gordonia desulfuricans TaxID=89051 RepID=A0A7K3LVV0_9ACTN|nr:DUF3027 domain-containing protein [Gordonia desulfuricans]NDK92415.1 DUF3027 domain-containing protein [Gordonia desulfuricans]
MLHTGTVTGVVDGPRLLDAVDIARAALIEDGHRPGEHRHAVAEGEWAAAHYFDADLIGYRGWQWCVVVAGAPGSDEVTVSEVVLLPGDGALLSPSWVPWSKRVAPGDLSAGDVLAADPDDVRLVPNQIDTGDEFVADPDEIAQISGALGLGRKRLLSREGRDEAAQRWYDGDFGPGSEMAQAAQFPCCTCGFYIPLSGSLRAAFGACANEFSADAHVVSAEYGCGAHSDMVAPKGEGTPAFDAFDDGVLEIVAVSAGAGADDPDGRS